MTTLQQIPKKTEQVNLFLKFLGDVKFSKVGDSFVIEVHKDAVKSDVYFMNTKKRLTDQTIGQWVKDIQNRIAI